MSQNTNQTRRQILKLTGSAAAIGLAGCSSLAQTSDGDDGNGENHDDENGGEQHDEAESGDHHDEEDGGDHDEADGEHNDGEDGDHHDEADGEHNDGEDEHGHNHDEGVPEEPSATAEVTLKTSDGEHHFGPHVTWIEPGGKVTWTLESGSHDVVAYHPDNDRPLRMPEDAEAWSSDLLSESGATFEHVFETEGVYDYYCTPHEAVGMVGTVIVGEPDAHGQPALEEPQESLPDGARSELADLVEIVEEALGHQH